MLTIKGLKRGSRLVHGKQRARQKSLRTAQRHGKVSLK